MIRTMVVEDFPIFRAAISRALQLDQRIDLVGAYPTARGLLDAIVMDQVQALLLDLHLPDMEGTTLIERVRQVSPQTRIVVFTASEQPRQVRAALAAGAHGYVVKRQESEQIIDALIAVCAGGTVLAPQVAASLLSLRMGGTAGEVGNGIDELRPSDLQILSRLVDGETDAQIAGALYVSTRTVQNHLARIRSMAGVVRRPELARWAIEHALV
ncbi:MAG: two component transcriptional regulator, LuxR family [Thermoleophilia bacterium]|nr:two component transcriptional regulator, LuxR family [Thermoleophilia bacterium]